MLLISISFDGNKSRMISVLVDPHCEWQEFLWNHVADDTSFGANKLWIIRVWCKQAVDESKRKGADMLWMIQFHHNSSHYILFCLNFQIFTTHAQKTVQSTTLVNIMGKYQWWRN